MIHSDKAEPVQVRIRFDKTGGLEIDGDGQNLTRVAEWLKTSASGSKLYTLEEASESAFPYDGFLELIEVLHDDRQLRIARQETGLRISGTERVIGLLADSIAGLVAQSDSRRLHCHLEYYDGHPFLDPDTEPLVVEVGESAGTT